MKLGVPILAAACLGCEAKSHETIPATTSSRYTISVDGPHRFSGAQGQYRIIEVVDRRLSRKYVVLESSGSTNPPKVDGHELSSSMTLLSKSQIGGPE